ncbi:putative capsular polysaccharide synthesis family protein [Pseudoalteromonas marina]|uniref:putative capsular polysaccharide synthesis family protein n=1 Tax=Pseudoalteromonas marina TaxID=267375 RepID=UPI0023F39608|nr:putative capsular polysaccharide synthesis family protein [Pseudoalteromonas marina]
MLNNYESATPKKMGLLEKVKKWFSSEPIVIFSVGKVGSSSIAKTLREHNISEVQPHSLSFSRKGSYFVLPTFNPLESLFYYLKSNLIKIKTYIFKLSKKHKRIKIISLYREPVSRNISAFFEQYQYVLNNHIDTYSTEELVSAFWKYTNHDAPLKWFDNELKNVFGIDIHDYEFDKGSGYLLVKKGNVDLLLLTMEKMDENSAIIGDFVGIENFKLAKTNRAEKKVYSEQYNHFKKNILIPKDYLNKFYNDPVINFFYSTDDLKKYSNKWRH